MQKFEPRSGQFSLVSGIQQSTSDLITVVEPTSLFAPEARKGRLYLLVEPDNDAVRSLAACQLVARTACKAFYTDSSSSITAALRAAMRAANKALYEYNAGHPARQRTLVGMSCAAIKGSDLFLAQVAPAQAFILAQGRLRALPTPLAWGATRSGVPALPDKPLGSSLFVEPELYRASLGLSDVTLLCSRNLAPLFDRGAIEALLQGVEPEALLNQLAQQAAEHNLLDAHALAIVCAPVFSRSAQQAPFSPTGVGEYGRVFVRNAMGWVANLGYEAQRATRQGRADGRTVESRRVDDQLTRLPAQPDFSPDPPARPRPIDLGESLEVRHEREQVIRHGTASRDEAAATDLPLSSYLGEHDYLPPPRTPKRIDLGDGPALAANAQPYRPRYDLRPVEERSFAERLLQPLQRASFIFGDTVRRRRVRRPEPQRAATTRVSGLSYRRQQSRFPWLLLSVLTLVVTLLIFYGTLLSQQNAAERALDYFSIAEQRMAEVREAGDDALALERLEIARQAIDEVRASPNVTVTNTTLWLRYQDLQREYERALAAVQRLTFFDEVTLLATHPLPNGRFAAIAVPPATSAITDPRVIENLRYIYALDGDPESARLFRIPRDGGAARSYLAPGDTVQTTIVGPLRAQAWRTDQVVAVDRGPGGFGYYFRSGDAWNYTKLGDSEIWSGRDRLDIETYDGNLYVWGAEPGEILKYNSGFYGDAPLFWIDSSSLENQDLNTAVDMAIDGNIYLLRPEGTILVFSVGRLVTALKPDAITPPIAAVTRMFVAGAPDDGFIFLLDTLNERLIQLDKRTGTIIQQIKAHPDTSPRLNELADLWVDASGSRPIIYLVNGGNIYRTALPAPPRPFRQSVSTPTPTP